MLDVEADVDVVLNLAELNALTMKLDLGVLATGNMKSTVMVISDEVASFVHPPRPVPL